MPGRRWRFTLPPDSFQYPDRRLRQNMQMRIIEAEATRHHLQFVPLIAAIERMFVQGCEVPQRHRHDVAGAASPGGTVLLMPAWRPGAFLGIKTVSIFAGNRERGLPGLHSAYLLMDAATGVPLAMIDGNEITSRRTAAASALAARYLARPDAGRLLVVGAGRVARLLPEAYGAVRPIREVQVWARREEAAQALVTGLRAVGWAATVAPDLQAAVGQADIVSCATLSEAPLVHGAWLKSGTHLDLIGGFAPAMRETDDACVALSRVFIDTEEALLKAGDLLAPIASGVFCSADVCATLAQLCRGEHPGRTHDADITLFKSVGTALEDLAAATLVYQADGGREAQTAG